MVDWVVDPETNTLTQSVIKYTVLVTVLWFLFFASMARAGELCDAFEQGLRDGWCLTHARSPAPCMYSPYPPMCFENGFTSIQQAYLVGFERGRNVN